MNKASKYRFFQLHLSILIVTAMAASGLFWLDVRPHKALETFDQDGRLIQWTVLRGWPMKCYEDSNVYARWSLNVESAEPLQTKVEPIGTFQFRALAIDVVVNGLCVLIVAGACEYIVRKLGR